MAKRPRYDQKPFDIVRLMFQDNLSPFTRFFRFFPKKIDLCKPHLGIDVFWLKIRGFMELAKRLFDLFHFQVGFTQPVMTVHVFGIELNRILQLYYRLVVTPVFKIPVRAFYMVL